MQEIADWKELKAYAETDPSETHRIEIENVDLCNGWLVNKETGEHEHYLSTHTFYGLNYQHSSELLQRHGFNVNIKNWDAKA